MPPFTSERVLDPSEWIAPLAEHFGFAPPQLAPYSFYLHGRSYLAIAAADHRSPALTGRQAVGQRFLRLAMKVPRLTNLGARILAPWATKQLIALDEAQVDAFLARARCALTVEQRAEGRIGTGQAIVSERQGLALGVGHVHSDGEGCWLESFFPRRLRPGDLRRPEASF